MCLVMALCFTACQNGGLDRKTGSLRISAFAYEGQVVSRATADGYTDFANTYGATSSTPVVMSLWAVSTDGTPFENTASYNGSVWNSYCRLEPGRYDFYSYLPTSIKADDGVGVTLAPTSSPATLTFSNVPAVCGKDLLVSAGIPSGDNATTDNPYDQQISDSEGQTVTFRMEHVLAKLSLSFSNPTGKAFTDMRKIVVKEVQVLSAKSDSKHNVTCTMNKTGSITYNWVSADLVPPGHFAMKNDTEFEIASGKKVNGYLVEAEATAPFGACYLVPFTGKTIKIRAIYDVYAHDGSLIRADEISVNTNLTVTNTTTIDAGKEYKVNVKIIPDYLYVLADIDAGTSLEIKTE